MTTAKAIAVAILLCQPGLGNRVASRYAGVLADEARQHRFDPMTAAALICHESHWLAGAVSRDGEDYGLGQVRARFIGACRADLDPVSSPSPSCLATKASLLDPVYNIRVVAEQIERWKRLCRSKTGRRATDQQWLSGYGGLSRPAQGTWCGLRRSKGRWVALPTAKVVLQVLRYRRLLASGQRPSLRTK